MYVCMYVCIKEKKVYSIQPDTGQSINIIPFSLKSLSVSIFVWMGSPLVVSTTMEPGTNLHLLITSITSFVVGNDKNSKEHVDMSSRLFATNVPCWLECSVAVFEVLFFYILWICLVCFIEIKPINSLKELHLPIPYNQWWIWFTYLWL